MGREVEVDLGEVGVGSRRVTTIQIHCLYESIKELIKYYLKKVSFHDICNDLYDYMASSKSFLLMLNF